MMGNILCVHEGVKRGPHRDGGIMRRWLLASANSPFYAPKSSSLVVGSRE